MQTDVRESTVRAAGQEILVQEFGEGPPLLLIHGFLVGSADWRKVFPYLGKDFRCIALDLPGFARSSKPSPEAFEYSMQNYASVVDELLSELGIEQCDVAAQSMGATIALQLALDHPQRVRRLAVADAMWHPYSVPLKGKSVFLGRVGEFVFKKLYGRALFRDYFASDVFNGKAHDVEQVDAYYEHFNTPEGRTAAYAVLHNIVRPENLRPLAARVHNIEHETLVIWGVDDRIFPVSLSDKLVRELPNAELLLLSDCGHAPHEEQPEAVSDAFRKHFSKDSARGIPASAS